MLAVHVIPLVSFCTLQLLIPIDANLIQSTCYRIRHTVQCTGYGFLEAASSLTVSIEHLRLSCVMSKTTREHVHLHEYLEQASRSARCSAQSYTISVCNAMHSGPAQP